jgi:integrase
MLRTRYDNARKAAAIANPALAEGIKAMFLRDTRKRAADLADDMGAASELLQHSSQKVTATHYRTKATKLKSVR